MTFIYFKLILKIVLILFQKYAFQYLVTSCIDAKRFLKNIFLFRVKAEVDNLGTIAIIPTGIPKFRATVPPFPNWT